MPIVCNMRHHETFRNDTSVGTVSVIVVKELVAGEAKVRKGWKYERLESSKTGAEQKRSQCKARQVREDDLARAFRLNRKSIAIVVGRPW